MNIFCYVADTKVAESVIVRDLKTHGFLEGAVMAERNGDGAELLWPTDFKSAFSLNLMFSAENLDITHLPPSLGIWLEPIPSSWASGSGTRLCSST